MGTPEQFYEVDGSSGLQILSMSANRGKNNKNDAINLFI